MDLATWLKMFIEYLTLPPHLSLSTKISIICFVIGSNNRFISLLKKIKQFPQDGEITQQEYREMKADYERQAAGLSDLLARLTAERKQLSNGVDQQHPALVAFAKYQNIEKLTREILIELVDHIKIYENGNISVHFKFADEFRRIAEYIEINTTDTAEAG